MPTQSIVIMKALHYSPPAHTGLNIVYQDDELLALDKPAGLLSVPGRGGEKQDSLASRVQVEYPEARVVHRLDMATSGLMLMARNETMQRRLGMMFEQREIDKRYIAIVGGKFENASGVIELPLITDWPNRPRQKIDHAIGKPALTAYRVLEYDPEQNTSRVELRPKTGRTHQLRVHMQASGHPILGDQLYAPNKIRDKSSRLALHADLLVFIHPAGQGTLRIGCEAPF